MKRCSFSEWIPILPLPIWPLAGQCSLGQNVVVGSMTLLLAVRGNIATRSMSGPSFALQLHCTTVNCGATERSVGKEKREFAEVRWMEISSYLKRISKNGTRPVKQSEFQGE